MTATWRGTYLMYTAYPCFFFDELELLPTTEESQINQLENLAARIESDYEPTTHVVSIERGTENNRLHLQGFIGLGARARAKQILDKATKIRTELQIGEKIPSIHWVAVGATKTDIIKCARYCNKTDKQGFVKNLFARAPAADAAGQGRRRDVLCLRDAVKAGKSDVQLYSDDSVAGAAIRYGPAVSRMRHAFTLERLENGTDEGCLIVAFTGATGLGKSLFISHILANLAPGVQHIRLTGDSSGWKRGVGGQPWLSPDQTDLHKVAVIEEWKDNYTATCLNAMADCKIGTHFPNKGGHSPWNCRLLLISSNIKVKDWYSGDGEAIVNAVKRRVVEIDVNTTQPFYRAQPDGVIPAGWNRDKCQRTFERICLELARRDTAPCIKPSDIFKPWRNHVWWNPPDNDAEIEDGFFDE